MFTVKVMPDGAEPYTVKTTTRDIAQWEKTTKGASFAGLQSEMKAVDLYKITFLASVRQNLYVGTLADFEKSVDLDVLDDEDVAADPTRPAA